MTRIRIARDAERRQTAQASYADLLPSDDEGRSHRPEGHHRAELHRRVLGGTIGMSLGLNRRLVWKHAQSVPLHADLA
jgi:hypothetical protein